MTTGPSTTERPSTAAAPSTPFDVHDSQSKLREILRDQSRREEQQSPSPATLQRHASHPTKASASSSSLANLATSPGSDYFGTNSTSPSKRETALPHMGASNLTDLYTASRTGLTSPQHRELARQPYADTLGAAPEIMPGGAGSKLARSQSSAGLSNGLDLKVVILGAQGECAERAARGRCRCSPSLRSSGVGKTSLVHRYTSGHFSASSVPSTIGASFLTKKLIVDGVKVRLQLWDTAGQERFRSMSRRGPARDSFVDLAPAAGDQTKPAACAFCSFSVCLWRTPEHQSAHCDLVDCRPAQLTAIFSFDGNEPTGQLWRTGRPGVKPAYGLACIQRGRWRWRRGRRTLEPVLPARVTEGGQHAQGGRHRDEVDFIDVSEVSSKDNEGIEDVFVGIATRLVERKEAMEELARKRLDRTSVFLGEGEPQVPEHARVCMTCCLCLSDMLLYFWSSESACLTSTKFSSTGLVKGWWELLQRPRDNSALSASASERGKLGDQAKHGAKAASDVPRQRVRLQAAF
ncbi:hypothetical protein L7F22_055030 [Adiantum nelumboides]|nr:hypothetical protein [Adiantum nelumboides]